LLRFRLGSGREIAGIVGNSPGMLAMYSAVLRIAPRRHSVLITGETGTGKELVARALHRHGANPEAPFMAVDCASLAPGVIESELFGHVRGAFTGAVLGRPGLFAAAAGGTLFLDEIGELPLDVQARLFRVLQEGEFRPVGSDVARKTSARVVAATDRNLEEAIAAGAFRQELYFRLNVHHLHVPPLRARKTDIPELVEHFLHKHSEGRAAVVGADLMEELQRHEWPGNVRELENCVLHMLAEAEGSTLGRVHLPRSVRSGGRVTETAGSPLEHAEKTTIQAALDVAGGNVATAALQLGISKATLYRKLERYSLGSGRRHRETL
jgi:DNA-binding NtrC family response regulator